MNNTKLANFDLNLLRVFNALLEERSVTRAAKRLAITPSGVSHALNKLRYILNDELFTRSAGFMQPSVLASGIAPRLQQALLNLQSALTPAEFIPAQSERRFTISATPYTSWLLLPGLIPLLKIAAPKAEIRIQRSGGPVLEDLDAGRIDLAIGVFGEVPERFEVNHLLSDRMVWVMRRGHKAAAKKLTLKTLAAIPHMILAAEAEADAEGSIRHGSFVRYVVLDDHGRLNAELSKQGLQRTIELSVPDALSALAVAASSDLTILLPRRFATAFARHYDLKLSEPPYACPDVKFGVLWRRAPDPGPAVAWLRARLHEVARSL